MEEIVMDFGKDGSTRIKVNGVKGKSCADLTKQIEAALGETTSDVKTTDFYTTGTQAQAVRQK